MRKIGLAAAFMAIALFAFAVPVSAKTLPSNGLTRAEVLKWLQGHGLSAKMDYDEVAKDSTVSVTAGSLNWSVYFYNCSNDHCTSLQYVVAWNGDKATLENINNWNSNRRFLRAYKNPAGLVFAEFDVDIMPGGTWELIDYSLERWQKQLTVFETFMNTGKLPS
jgi:putative sensory transduction regulator